MASLNGAWLFGRPDTGNPHLNNWLDLLIRELRRGDVYVAAAASVNNFDYIDWTGLGTAPASGSTARDWYASGSGTRGINVPVNGELEFTVDGTTFFRANGSGILCDVIEVLGGGNLYLKAAATHCVYTQGSVGVGGVADSNLGMHLMGNHSNIYRRYGGGVKVEILGLSASTQIQDGAGALDIAFFTPIGNKCGDITLYKRHNTTSDVLACGKFFLGAGGGLERLAGDSTVGITGGGGVDFGLAVSGGNLQLTSSDGTGSYYQYILKYSGPE